MPKKEESVFDIVHVQIRLLRIFWYIYKDQLYPIGLGPPPKQCLLKYIKVLTPPALRKSSSHQTNMFLKRVKTLYFKIYLFIDEFNRLKQKQKKGKIDATFKTKVNSLQVAVKNALELEVAYLMPDVAPGVILHQLQKFLNGDVL